LVTPKNVGTYRWLTREEHLLDPTELEDMETRLRGSPELSSTILRLCLSGSLPLGGRAELDRRLVGIEAALFHLDVDDSRLSVRPTPEDLETIDFDGVLRRAADRLKSMIDDADGPIEKRRAEDALVQLFFMAAGNGGAGP
jgi:hypothetical protein